MKTVNDIRHDQNRAVLKFPERPKPLSVRDVLKKALDESDKLESVLVLGQRADGGVYNLANDEQTVASVNWLVDSYKFWLMNVGTS